MWQSQGFHSVTPSVADRGASRLQQPGSQSLGAGRGQCQQSRTCEIRSEEKSQHVAKAGPQDSRKETLTPGCKNPAISHFSHNPSPSPPHTDLVLTLSL